MIDPSWHTPTHPWQRPSRLLLACLLLMLSIVLSACNLPGAAEPAAPARPTSATVIVPLTATPLAAEMPLQPTPDFSVLPPSEVPPTLPPAATLPPVATLPPTTAPSGPQLTFLRDGDVWLYEPASGQTYQLTVVGDVKTFAWAPDGQRLAMFNGKSLCFVQHDGQATSACLELGLDDTLAQIDRHIVWSSDQRWIVLWNPVNPWDEGAIGWLLVPLDAVENTLRIQDPVDWGASLAPNNEAGGITGEPLFLPDGRLLGSLTHRILCSSGGCHYMLYQFDLETRSFSLFPNQPENGWSEGMRLQLTRDGQQLVNFGAFFFGCDSPVTFVDTYNLATQERQTYNLENTVMAELAMQPAAGASVFSRTGGCVADPQAQPQPNWNQSCGLSPGFDVLSMQRWDMAANSFSDLPPGLEPTWSPDGAWLVFRSCLLQDAAGAWQASSNGPPALYLLNPADNQVTVIGPGGMPVWRP